MTNQRLQINIGSKVFQFESLQEFEFSLSGRTMVSSSKLIRLLQQSPAELKMEALSIRKLEKTLVRVVSTPEDNLHELLNDINVKLFSREYDWRLIISALNDKDRQNNQFKRVALSKYLQYLSACYEIIRQIFKNRINISHPEQGHQLIKQQRNSKKSKPTEDRVRLATKKSMQLPLKNIQKVELFLASHLYQLTGIKEEKYILFDELGKEYKLLSDKKNMIGRHRSNDVVVDKEFGDISRVHLIMEISQKKLILNDISSNGTFLSKNLESKLTLNKIPVA